MRVTNGRFHQVGHDNGKPVRFYGMPSGLGADASCVNGYDEYGVACSDWTPITDDSTTLDAALRYMYGSPTTGAATVTMKPPTPIRTVSSAGSGSNMSMLILVMAGAAILFAMK